MPLNKEMNPISILQGYFHFGLNSKTGSFLSLFNGISTLFWLFNAKDILQEEQ